MSMLSVIRENWITLVSGSALPIIVGFIVWLIRTQISKTKINSRIAVYLYEYAMSCLSVLEEYDYFCNRQSPLEDEDFDDFNGKSYVELPFLPDLDKFIYNLDVEDKVSNKLIGFRILFKKINEKKQVYRDYLYDHPEFIYPELGNSVEKNGIYIPREKQADFNSYNADQCAILAWKIFEYSLVLRKANKTMDKESKEHLEKYYNKAILAKSKSRYSRYLI